MTGYTPCHAAKIMMYQVDCSDVTWAANGWQSWDLKVLHSTGLVSWPMTALGHSGAIDKTLPIGAALTASQDSMQPTLMCSTCSRKLRDLLIC